MTHSVLLVLNENFDDMMFLTSQVVLEENDCDVIICSDESKTVKGETSSVMTVSLENALKQDVEYDAIVVVGGNNLTNWDLLKQTVGEFHNKGKLVATISEMMPLLSSTNASLTNSSDSFVYNDGILILNDLSKCEEFVDEVAKKLQ